MNATGISPSSSAATAVDVDPRSTLLEQRNFRLEQLAALPEPEQSRMADGSRDQVIFEIKSAALMALRDIETALDRLDDGTYGLCESCGQAIVSERLAILPMARYCMPCQREKEAAGYTATRLLSARQVSASQVGRG